MLIETFLIGTIAVVLHLLFVSYVIAVEYIADIASRNIAQLVFSLLPWPGVWRYFTAYEEPWTARIERGGEPPMVGFRYPHEPEPLLPIPGIPDNQAQGPDVTLDTLPPPSSVSDSASCDGSTVSTIRPTARRLIGSASPTSLVGVNSVPGSSSLGTVSGSVTSDESDARPDLEFFDVAPSLLVAHKEIVSAPMLKTRKYRAGFYANVARSHFPMGAQYDEVVEDLLAFARIKLVGRHWNEATQSKFMQIMNEELDYRQLLINRSASRLRLLSHIWLEFAKPGPMELATMAAQSYDVQKLLVAREQMIGHIVDNNPPFTHRLLEWLTFGLWSSPVRLVELPRA